VNAVAFGWAAEGVAETYGMTYGKTHMVKTTVYLPEELKKRIENTARLQRKSEAEVIRAALDAYTQRTYPRPRLPLFEEGDLEPISDWDAALEGFGED
jgi:Arc/MetJ-type ribon-helix-helix transcriptional regulator